jgi:glycosyltransferase involved in cell wall biosynthesis
MLRALGGAGWDCHVAVPHRARLAAEYAAAGATLHVVPMRRVTSQGHRLRWAAAYAAAWAPSVAVVTALARRLGADVVHSNSLHSWYGWAAAEALRRPHVWHAREIVVQSGGALRLERQLARRFADLVVATSHAVAAQLDPVNVQVVLDAPEPGEFGPEHAGRFRAALGVPDDVALVGSVGRIDTWKGFEVLLDAVPLIRARRPGVQVVVAGAPVGGKEAWEHGLRRRAAGLGGVHWLGPRRDVPELMADLDVFAQVSTEPEPFGLVHAEALAAGTPVVAGAEGGPVEILAGLDASAGRLVAPGDAGALAAAVVELLPCGPSSTARRRARPVLRAPVVPDWDGLFTEVLGRRRADPSAPA